MKKEIREPLVGVPNYHKKQPSTPIANQINVMNIQPKAILNSDNKHKVPEDKTPPKFVDNKKPEVNAKPVVLDFKKQHSEEISKGIINVGIVNSDNKKKDQRDINDFMAKKLEQKKKPNIVVTNKIEVTKDKKVEQPKQVEQKDQQLKGKEVKEDLPHLKEFIKKMREKNKKDSGQEVVWMKGMNYMLEKDEKKEKKEKERKFPEVIIMEKEVKQKKKQEEFYLANKMFLELDVSIFG
jgi:hypothetical protein